MTNQERSDSSKQSRQELPASYVEGRAYFEELKQNPEWVAEHSGIYVALHGRQLVDQDQNFHYLSVRVWPTYGEGNVYISRTWKEPKTFRITNVFSIKTKPQDQ